MAAKREQVLWETVWPIAKQLEKAFSLKAICSAGVFLFDQLSGDEQKQAIAQVNEAEAVSSPKKSLQDTIDSIKEMLEVEKQQPGTIYKVLSFEQQKIVDEFIKTVAPAPTQKKRRKSRA